MNNEIREDASLWRRIEGIERDLRMNELTPPASPAIPRNEGLKGWRSIKG
jgi:hypothetical protein